MRLCGVPPGLHHGYPKKLTRNYQHILSLATIISNNPHNTTLQKGFIKSAQVPFQSWLLGAMVAPTPVSALLHAVAVVKVGVFSIVRVMTGIFGIDLLAHFNLGIVVMCIASVTILTASCIALSQDELLGHFLAPERFRLLRT